MPALVNYTALTPATGFNDTFPICAASPVDGVGKDFWRKIRIDFTLTNLEAADWAKIMVIPAHTYVFEVITVIVAQEGQGSGLTIGDANSDSDATWLSSQAADTKDVVKITLVADANGATRGKYYHAAGAIYCSGTSKFDALILDVYVHCMTIDPA